MSDAPERIWVYHLANGELDAQHWPHKGRVEYIRADIISTTGIVMAYESACARADELDNRVNDLLEENARLREALRDIHMMVADDASAITYQTIGQYRTALLAAICTHLEADDE